MLDRVGLIIEIFNAHAQTREAKLQVKRDLVFCFLQFDQHLGIILEDALRAFDSLQAELAALNYKKTRLIRTRGPGGRYTFGESGEAEVVSARG